MSNTITKRFITDSGIQLFNGNELIVKGALETEGGVHLMTGYPGSPVATFFDTLNALGPTLRKHGIEGRLANNEALAVAAINGSQMAPLRAMAVFKSVGLHVASDALALGNLAGPHPEGGAVMVVGDDPWSESTQVPADSRFLLRHLFVPVLEPSSAQEIKDYVDIAFKLSRAGDLYIGYLITTTLADGGGSVKCRPNHYPLANSNHRLDLNTLGLNLSKTVLLPPRTGQREVDMPDRFANLHAACNDLGLNALYDVSPDESPAPNETVIVTSGLAHQYVQQAMSDLGLANKIPILKLDITYPLERERFEQLLDRFDNLLVIEERRSFIEEQISDIALHYHQRRQRTNGRDQKPIAAVWGKQFPGDATGFPSALGLNASIISDRLSRYLKLIDSPIGQAAEESINIELNVIGSTAKVDADLPTRTPAFCPGCPHRDSSSVFLEIKEQFLNEGYMRKRHRRGAVDLVFHGDTGCYTMLMFEPNSQLMHNYSGMGLGGGTGSGIDPFIRNKQVVFMGDSTFFHSGTIAISNSVNSLQDITYIILANGTTAMTGHQPVPGIDADLLGRPIPVQDIERNIRAIVGEQATIVRANPGDRDNYKELLEQTILGDGVKIIIADKECGITYYRRKTREERAETKKRGYLRKKTFMNITPEVCELCLECSNATGCPGLTIEPSDYGPKMATDLSWCVNDGACAKIDACPSFEQVIVKRKRTPTPRGHRMMLQDIPEPTLQNVDENGKLRANAWRAWVAGVGGMGIGTVTNILVHAGRYQGYHVQFSDKKGLAIRNGGVYSQLVYSNPAQPAGMTVGYGKADLLLGIDLLEATRAVNARSPFRVADPNRTTAVVNVDPTPTIRMLLDGETADPEGLEAILRGVTRPNGYFAAHVSSLCERIFGTKLYANITMLGVAYQRGLIPVTHEAVQHGINETIRGDAEKNLRAFDLGRKLVTHPELFAELFAETRPERTLARTVREKAAYLNMRRLGARRALRKETPGAAGKRRLPDTKLARTYKHLVYTTLRACRELDRETMQDIAVRIYDLIQWGGVRYARRYVERIRRTFLADHESRDFAATRAVVWNLAKLMLIKDEFYVPYLLTSYEKLRRDRQRYNVNPANGDKIVYRRTFHPRFFGKQIDVTVPHWSLYIMRNLHFMRHVIPFYRYEEKDFLRWYEQMVDEFETADPTGYDQWIELLRTPENVTGFAEIRSPKIEKAKSRGNQLLATIRKNRKAIKLEVGSDK